MIKNIRRIDEPSYVIDQNVLKRFDVRSTAFSLSEKDPDSIQNEIGIPVDETAIPLTTAQTRLADQSIAQAGETLWGHLTQEYCGLKKSSAAEDSQKQSQNEHLLSDPTRNSELVKHAALQFGADSIGICQLKQMWVYSHDRSDKSLDIADDYPWTIVIAIAMDPQGIRQSPHPAARAATRIGYMKSTVCVSGLSLFIKELGYKAIAATNELALSIPLAIDAGLGEMGRNGLLVTPDFGPCARICKVLTNLPLKPDKPISTGLIDSCRKCDRCARACHAQAIDNRPEPTFEIVCKCNNPGILRWPIDARKCHSFRSRHQGACATCIAVCPFTPKPAES